ncbi:MAG: hypothetical protein ABI703_10375 [Gemmatimonadales bacterium]
MIRSVGVALLVLALVSCRAYDLESRLTDQDGLVPPDRYARYGRDQAQEVAIAREYGHAHDGSTLEDLRKRADTAVRYARTLPDVTDAGADPLGFRLTIHFKSGWRTMVTPIDDGKRGAETGGLPAEPGTSPGR